MKTYKQTTIIKSGLTAFNKVNRLSKRQPGGAMPKNQASAIMHKPFETVFDNGIDRQGNVCFLCSSYACEVARFKMPENAQIRLRQERLTCLDVIKLYKLEREIWKVSDARKDKLSNEKKALSVSEHNNKALLLSVKPLKELNALEVSLTRSLDVIVRAFEKNVILKSNYDKQAYKLAIIQQAIELKSNDRSFAYRSNLKAVLEYNTERKETIKRLNRYVFPNLLTKEQENERIENAKTAKNEYTRKGILKRVYLTREVIAKVKS